MRIGFNIPLDIIGHFDESFQAVDCICTDNEEKIHKTQNGVPATQIEHVANILTSEFHNYIPSCNCRFYHIAIMVKCTTERFLCVIGE